MRRLGAQRSAWASRTASRLISKNFRVVLSTSCWRVVFGFSDLLFVMGVTMGRYGKEGSKTYTRSVAVGERVCYGPLVGVGPGIPVYADVVAAVDRHREGGRGCAKMADDVWVAVLIGGYEGVPSVLVSVLKQQVLLQQERLEAGREVTGMVGLLEVIGYGPTHDVRGRCLELHRRVVSPVTEPISISTL